MAQRLPKLVSKFCNGHGAWIVGSGARDTEPKDWDVVVPFNEWKQAALLVPENAKPNSFGGWRCVDHRGNHIDIWPADLGLLMTHDMVTHLWHPLTNTRFIKHNSET